jgi:hypothetical protein
MGTSTSNRPESCVDVVVARINVGLAGTVGSGVGGTAVGGTIVGGGTSVGAAGGSEAGAVVGAAEPHDVNRMEKTSRSENRILGEVGFIVIPCYEDLSEYRWMPSTINAPINPPIIPKRGWLANGYSTP